MSKIINVKESFKSTANIDAELYADWYTESQEYEEDFWSMMAERLDWDKEPEKVKNASFNPVSIKWFEDGKINVANNCIDRHLELQPNKTAIIWQGDNPSESKNISYAELHKQVCKFANVLKNNGVKKGDRVTIYMPMIPEAAYAMLATVRIGAVHSVVFAGFSPESLASRIDNCESDFVITADEGVRGGKTTPLKNNTDEAIKLAKRDIQKTFVVERTGGKTSWNNDRDVWYHEEMDKASDRHRYEVMNAEDPMFILYTSGSTGKPKGIMHTTGGYLLYSSLTHYCIFDIKDDDVYWCTADIGWITGHSYSIYGPLANGATTLMFEGVPTYPDVSRFWQIVEQHKVSILYTAPTAIRALMQCGDEPVTKHNTSSLRLLGTVGEPINPEAWSWYNKIVGKKECPIVDTWWQTETGGIMISPLPGATPLKPGSATLPFFGIKPCILDKDGKEIKGEGEGYLCIKDSWPGQARSIYGDHKRFEETYFSQFKGYYTTGDGAKRDKSGYYWITGRVDDVLNVSGHRLGTAEIESALVAHKAVCEAAVVGYPHDIKGQGIYAYVNLMQGQSASAELNAELIEQVTKEISAIAKPDVIHFATDLPKTRSGKIMRRILRKIAEDDTENLGDTSTLLNPNIVEELIQTKANKAS